MSPISRKPNLISFANDTTSEAVSGDPKSPFSALSDVVAGLARLVHVCSVMEQQPDLDPNDVCYFLIVNIIISF
jgi:hypothetical protein